MYLLQIAQIVYSIIIPRWLLIYYGSNVNGLLASITQFLSYIALMDAGVSAVLRSMLYKPLATKEYFTVQIITNSAQRFYRKIAFFFVFYLLSISIILPIILSSEFNWIYTCTLIFIVGLSTFSEYYFGIAYSTLLDADQKKYIYCTIHGISIIINLVISIILIKLGFSIHLVKLATAFVYMIKPIAISRYVRHAYEFNSNNSNTIEIKNKWVGMANHIAYFLHTHIDIILLTIVKGAKIVSVYSVYSTIVMGLVSLINSSIGGIEGLFGKINARNEQNKLIDVFNMTEYFVFTLSTILFSVAMVTIIPFINIYTRGITDVNYKKYLFAVLLLLAEFFYCIRIPYQSVIVAIGKIKETMKGAVVEVALNLVISITLVWKYSMVGLVIGTLCGMIYRTINYSLFISGCFIKVDIYNLLKRLVVAFVEMVCIVFLMNFLMNDNVNSYYSWIILACKTTIMSTSIVMVTNFCIFRGEASLLGKMIFERAGRVKKK